MTILFCTNSFENVTNGPSKFANTLLHLNEWTNISCHILTPDTTTKSKFVHKLEGGPSGLNKYWGMLSMGKLYARNINRLKHLKPDVIVLNNATNGYLLIDI